MINPATMALSRIVSCSIDARINSKVGNKAIMPDMSRSLRFERLLNKTPKPVSADLNKATDSNTNGKINSGKGNVSGLVSNKKAGKLTQSSSSVDNFCTCFITKFIMPASYCFKQNTARRGSAEITWSRDGKTAR